MSPRPPATSLPSGARALVDSRQLAAIGTHDPSGWPQLTWVWVKRDHRRPDDILFSTVRPTRKARNLARDPRVSLLMVDPRRPEAYLQVRGLATLTDDPAAALIDELSRLYTGGPFQGPRDQRVIVRIVPEHVHWRG